MRRVRITLQARAEWWRSQGAPWEGLDSDTAEGVQAYAFRQAKVNDTLLEQFTELWQQPLASKQKKRPLPSCPGEANACDDESDDDELPSDIANNPNITTSANTGLDITRTTASSVVASVASNIPEITAEDRDRMAIDSGSD